jgi:phospholipid-binding lipoprotein MlaA
MIIGCADQSATIRPFASPAPMPAAEDTAVAALDNDNSENHDNDDAAALLEEDWDLLAPETEQDFYSVADPLEPYNRAVFHFNDKLYFWVIKPVANGYRAVTPAIVRSGVKNFFTNLAFPARLINSVLQGKGQAAEAEFARFLYNSTMGVLGFGNPAKKHPQLNPDAEDLGQTLAVYSIGNGFYIVWPILGSSTLRDSLGIAGDWFLDPVFWIEPLEASIALGGYRRLNDASFRIGDYEALKKAAIDPYEALRNAYIQLRESKIRK